MFVSTGVSAAFDAPATGALFAIEFVLKSSRLGLDRLSTSTVFAATSVSAGVVGFLRSQGQALGITGAATHLVGRIPYFSVNPNLLTDVLQVRHMWGVGDGWVTHVCGGGATCVAYSCRWLPGSMSGDITSRCFHTSYRSTQFIMTRSLHAPSHCS